MLSANPTYWATELRQPNMSARKRKTIEVADIDLHGPFDRSRMYVAAHPGVTS